MKHFNQLYRAKRAELFGVSGLLLHLRGLGALAPGLWGGLSHADISGFFFASLGSGGRPGGLFLGSFNGGKGGSGALNTAWK